MGREIERNGDTETGRQIAGSEETEMGRRKEEYWNDGRMK